MRGSVWGISELLHRDVVRKGKQPLFQAGAAGPHQHCRGSWNLWEGPWKMGITPVKSPRKLHPNALELLSKS